MVQELNDPSSPVAGGQPRPVETYTLLTEAAPDLREIYDSWLAFYKPASPGERELLEIAIQSSIDRRRTLATLTELVNDQIRTAIFRHDIAEEDNGQKHLDILSTLPGQAILGLQRSAKGCEYMISRFERLLKLVREEGTLYGNDRNELINLSGARAGVDRTCLFESCGAYLVWLYALAAQPTPKDQHFIDLGSELYMPEELRDRQTEQWFGPPDVCRALLVELIENTLAHLRERERELRIQYAEPARAGAEVCAQVLRGPDGMQLKRMVRMHQQDFLQAYEAFLKGRKESRKSGAAPGAPVPDVAGGGAEPFVPPRQAPDEAEAERQAARQATAERQEEADNLAPGEKNGIGAPLMTGDAMREGVRARAAGPAAPPPAPPTEPGDSTGAYI
jgi:hypothetical protein